MPKKKKSEEPKVWPEDLNWKFSFFRETERLIDAGLWEETQHQVYHRFGDIRFISYSKPKTSLIKFKLAEKMWKVVNPKIIEGLKKLTSDLATKMTAKED